jgi:Anti-sigma-28 factor, FlgM
MATISTGSWSIRSCSFCLGSGRAVDAQVGDIVGLWDGRGDAALRRARGPKHWRELGESFCAGARAPLHEELPVADETRELCGERPATQVTTGRIEKIRARIDAGDYAVDLDELAEGFVVDEMLRARGLR